MKQGASLCNQNASFLYTYELHVLANIICTQHDVTSNQINCSFAMRQVSVRDCSFSSSSSSSSSSFKGIGHWPVFDFKKYFQRILQSFIRGRMRFICAIIGILPSTTWCLHIYWHKPPEISTGNC
jgi:hypothetical protein